MIRIEVPAAGSPYFVLIEENLLESKEAPHDFWGRGGELIVVTDENVGRHHLEHVLAALRSWGERPEHAVVASGEKSKSIENALALVDRMQSRKFGRNARMLSLGGGVVGDLTGFVASLYMRGIRYSHMPTSLLAQVDASIGGKVGVNYGGIKNVVGSFHQPAVVMIDPKFLWTLPEREYRSGLAEVVKMAAIGDAELFSLIEDSIPAILEREKGILLEIIERCCRFKASVVAEDPNDLGPRQALNFGHTVGHALEGTNAQQGKLLHGEAVAIGMIAACHVAESLDLAPSDLRIRLERLLTELRLPVRCKGFEIGTVLERVGFDKKSESGRIRMVLTTQLGTAKVGIHSPHDVLRESLRCILN